ncbi:multiple epidermal growth factor-like domains protein 11 isoform X1 [Apis mellifera carnica]|nr:multiple epidermal growth factor-like domains protein 11 isoform X1 [Apis mellifera carnica]
MIDVTKNQVVDKISNSTIASACEPVCDQDCANGTCTEPNVCACNDGFEKDAGRSVQTRLRVLSQRFLRSAQCVPMLARLRPNGRVRLYAVLRERVRERGVRGAERVCVSRGFRAEWK